MKSAELNLQNEQSWANCRIDLQLRAQYGSIYEEIFNSDI